MQIPTLQETCLKFDAVEQSGERMAVLTTLVGLLELKHLQMEGEDGTGSLESDIQLMEVLSTTSDALPAFAYFLRSACCRMVSLLL